MHQSFVPSRRTLSQGAAASSREGRDCELSLRLTRLVLFPRLDAMPGGWVLFLTGLCCFVAVKAMEQGLLGL